MVPVAARSTRGIGAVRSSAWTSNLSPRHNTTARSWPVHPEPLGDLGSFRPSAASSTTRGAQHRRVRARMSTRPGLKLGVLILDNSVGTGAGDRHTILPTPWGLVGLASRHEQGQLRSSLTQPLLDGRTTPRAARSCTASRSTSHLGLCCTHNSRWSTATRRPAAASPGAAQARRGRELTTGTDELGNYTERSAPFSSPHLRKSRAIRPTSGASTSPMCAIRTPGRRRIDRAGRFPSGRRGTALGQTVGSSRCGSAPAGWGCGPTLSRVALPIAARSICGMSWLV